MNASEAAVAGPDSDVKGLVPLVEENGYRLTQLCLYAIGPGEFKDCDLLTGIDVGVVEGHLPARHRSWFCRAVKPTGISMELNLKAAIVLGR